MNRYLKDKKARLEIRLSQNQKKLLENEAKYFKTSVSELIRNLIDKEHEEKKN